MEQTFSIKNLSKHYQDFSLQNINLSLPKGTILGLIGENGAGKSTIIKCLLNLIHRDNGEITIFDQTLEQNPKKIKDQIGVVFDECHFHGILNLKQINKIMKYSYTKWDEKRFFKLCWQFQLPEHKKIQTYSRGMQMKLSLACALSHHAKLLILDEPTSGLDPVTRNEILDLFLEFIQQEDNSIMLSTHITSDLDKIADYICCIHRGRVLFTDEKDQLLERCIKVKGPAYMLDELEMNSFIYVEKNAFHFTGMVKDIENWKRHYPDLIYEKPTLEEIMVDYTKKAQKNI